MKDQLLKSFEKFEISNKMKSEIRGGALVPNGCGQNGSVSTIDYIDAGGTQRCGAILRQKDAAGWCAAMFQ